MLANSHLFRLTTYRFLPYLKRFATDAVQNRQESALECVFKHFNGEKQSELAHNAGFL